MLAENAHPFEDPPLMMNSPFGLFELIRRSMNGRLFWPGQVDAGFSVFDASWSFSDVRQVYPHPEILLANYLLWSESAAGAR